MYFPILRGRQFELLALRECVNQGLLSNKIIPIVEPVKVSSTTIFLTRQENLQKLLKNWLSGIKP